MLVVRMNVGCHVWIGRSVADSSHSPVGTFRGYFPGACMLEARKPGEHRKLPGSVCRVVRA
eukprot:281140-Prymnesium_polylepis.1